MNFISTEKRLDHIQNSEYRIARVMRAESLVLTLRRKKAVDSRFKKSVSPSYVPTWFTFCMEIAYNSPDKGKPKSSNMHYLPTIYGIS